MAIVANDVRSVLSKKILADGFDIIFDIDKSHGSYMVDARNGDEYLDFFSMFASASIGYNHPYIVKHKDHLGRLAINKPSLSDIYTDSFAEFVKTFDEVAIPDCFKYAFFIDTGALGVENAIKAAFDWKTRKNLAAGKGEKGQQVIHFKEAFHGRSGYTLSLTNTDITKTMYFPKFKWPRIDNPKMSFPLNDENLQLVKAAEIASLVQIKQAINDNPDDIAAILIESIQGEGGDNHFRPEFFKALRKIADENEILLILDEVQTGIGISGKMWMFEHLGIEPDMISFGKKTQVCGFLAGPRMDEVADNVFVKSSRINSTFGGNMVDMARFKLILEVIRDEQLVENARKQGDKLLAGLESLASKYDHLSNVRGCGLWIAFDMPNSTKQGEFFQKALEHKLMIPTCGTKSIRLRPHLNLNDADLERGLEIFDKVLAATK